METAKHRGCEGNCTKGGGWYSYWVPSQVAVVQADRKYCLRMPGFDAVVGALDVPFWRLLRSACNEPMWYESTFPALWPTARDKEREKRRERRDKETEKRNLILITPPCPHKLMKVSKRKFLSLNHFSLFIVELVGVYLTGNRARQGSDQSWFCNPSNERETHGRDSLGLLLNYWNMHRRGIYLEGLLEGFQHAACTGPIPASWQTTIFKMLPKFTLMKALM